MKIVHPCGPQPNRAMLIGEAPGHEEAIAGRPFVGKAGRIQEKYLNLGGKSAINIRLANVVGEYHRGNPDPTPEMINQWIPILLAEILNTDPWIIVAVGKYATEWLLGRGANLELVHGIPHEAGCFDPSRKPRGNNAVILPIYHSAAGFHSERMRAINMVDYQQVCKYLDLVCRGKFTIKDIPKNEYPNPTRIDVDGKTFAKIIDGYGASEVGLDTEDDRTCPWSIQVSCTPGMGMVLRYEQPDFQIGINKLQEIADKGVRFIWHNLMHDFKVCREMKLDLSKALLHDTMRDLYMLRTEKWALKAAIYRWCGVRNARSHMEVVGPVTKSLREEYLVTIIAIGLLGDDKGIGEDLGAWPKIEPYETLENDGTIKTNNPWPIVRQVKMILRDSVEGKVSKDGELTNIEERWEKKPEIIRSIIENRLGLLPKGFLSDLNLDDAVDYAGADPDYTLRLKLALEPEIERLELTGVQRKDMLVIPMFEAMQDHGLPVSKAKIESLSNLMIERMRDTQKEITDTWFNSQPFNPGSDNQTRIIMELHGLEGTKLTKNGLMSTAADSIGHLDGVEPLITKIFYWRRCQHVHDVDCAQVIRRCIPENQDSIDKDIYYAKASLLPSTVTRRLAAGGKKSKEGAYNPLGVTKHNDFGELVRRCYIAPRKKVWLELDLSQIEVVVAASVSGDKLLCKIVRDGLDMHTQTAMRMFSLLEEEVIKELHRLPAKTTFFGWMYGQGYKALLQQFLVLGLKGWTEGKVKAFQDRFKQELSGLAKAIKQAELDVIETGVVRCSSGFIRHIPGVWSEDSYVKAESARFAWSHIVQGTAQDILQGAMVWIWPRLLQLKEQGYGVWPILSIHDSLLFLVNDDEETKAKVWKLVYEGMTEHHGVEMSVPVRADGSFGKSWDEL